MTIENEAPEVETEVIDDAESTDVAEDQSAEDESTDAEQDEGQQDEGDEGQDDAPEPFPKKAVNAISRRDKQIGKLRAERESLMREINALKSTSESQPKEETPEPGEDDFDSYGDYLKAQAQWAAKQAVNQSQTQQKDDHLKSLETRQQQVWQQEREAHVESRAAEVAQQVPDFTPTIQANAHVLDSMSPELETAFLSVDDAPTAFYNLAKEGKLESLAYMPIGMAHAEIVQAQYRKVPTKQQPKQATAAPAPIKSAKGTASSSKSLTNKTPDELMKWYQS